MTKPRVLGIIDRRDARHLDTRGPNRLWDIVWQTMDYGRLAASTQRLKSFVEDRKIDFAVFSQNEQVGSRVGIGGIIRKLETGYTTFSGIDDVARIPQMVSCFRDFLAGNIALDTATMGQPGQPDPGRRRNEGTFTLVFDCEQLGDVRFGLPRILMLLKKYRLPANFFVTNILVKVYANLIDVIAGHGHEPGIHGMYHEYLSKMSGADQYQRIRQTIRDFGMSVSGANFIDRMNDSSVEAMAQNRIAYFLYPNINYFRYGRYTDYHREPVVFRTGDTGILALPVDAETYGLSWFSIKNILDTLHRKYRALRHNHITILLHPFRDGSNARINTVEKIINHAAALGRKAVLLREVAARLRSEDCIEIRTAAGYAGLVRKNTRSGSHPRAVPDWIGVLPETFLHLVKKSGQRQIF